MLIRGRLNDAICKKLFHAARIAVFEEREEVIIRDETCYAVVRTQMKHAIIGGISGILFSGKIESDAGMAEATFIVRSRDLKKLDEQDLTWVSTSNSAPTRKNHTLN